MLQLCLVVAWAAVVVGLVGWVYLITTSQGLLLRYDPLYVNEGGVIQSAACTYTSGIETMTVCVIDDPKGATCPHVYKFGSIPLCVNFRNPSPGVCVWPE
jgi:hypothetical protein